ncbi:hypothetical protein B0J11DRAFT_572725 [Dendryphion nanum]|uniref:Uncharacterized protein n=1 Tax=Dendryphion nanum TaxID=256645 RepID=A0A9P9D613_9PLEO|nr:hypothetical protein B0J11DRAFT_572725 [Dendryphion nanum]
MSTQGQKNKKLVEVDAHQIGLDRSTINHQGQIRVPEHSQNDADQEDDCRTERSSHHQVLGSIKVRGHEAKAKLKRTLHVSKKSEVQSSEESPVLAKPVEESDSRLVEELPSPDKPTFQDFMHHPVDTVKSKASDRGSQQLAANIAAKEIPHGQEVDLLNAETALKQAVTEDERQLASEKLSRLLRQRQSTFVRWSLDRHVNKVRVLPRIPKRPRTDFEFHDPHGGLVIDWKAYGQHLLTYFANRYGGQYVGYGSSPPTPSKETIMPNIERLLIASAPFQEFIMTTRRVYRWEQPTETLKYLLIYLILWYFNLLSAGMLSAIMYLVIERFMHGNSLDDLREDVKHTENVHKTALSLSEFIEKRGDEKWADDIMQVLGPWLMVQLADMANFFESMRNFYEWRKRGRTASVLVVLGIAVMAMAFVPLWLLMKCLTFSAGFTFFALFPISVSYSDYRLLVSPTKRLFWNIPTHAEWAIMYIQAEGSRHKNGATLAAPTCEIKESRDYGSYTAHQNKQKGHLIIGSSSIRFASNTSHQTQWILPYDQINKIEKIDRVVAKKISKVKHDSGEGLKLVSKEGKEWELENMDERNQAFSQIVGFSPVTWQVIW